MQNGVNETHSSKQTIGSLLLQAGKIKPEDADRILATQKQYGIKFGDAALKLGLITDQDIKQIVSQQFDFDCLSVDDDSISNKVIAAFQSFGEGVEALRGVRGQLTLRWFTENKILVISPVQAGCGASYVASNLAVLFSQLGQKTLLIDADMREPSQLGLFKMAEKSGLSDLIAGRVELDVVSTHPVLSNLSILSAGTVPPNPLELLGQPRFKSILASLEEQYDIVLIDSPAIEEHCDAQILSSLTKGALLISKKDETKISEIKQATQKIVVAGAQPVGIVLNTFK